MAPLRQQVEATLKKENKALFASYQNDMKKLAAITNAKQQKMEMEKFTAKFYAFIKAGYTKAKIDEVGAIKSINQLLGGFKYKIKYGEFLSVTGLYTMPSNPTTTGGCVELKCPMDIRNSTHSANNSNAFPDGSIYSTIRVEYCAAKALSAAGVISANENRTELGKYVEVPPSLKKVEVSCKTNCFLNGWVFAAIGGGYIDGSIGLQFKGPYVDKKVEMLSRWAIAPLVWFTPYDDTFENFSMRDSFSPANSGGEYSVLVYAKTYALAAAISVTHSESLVSDFSPIKVCFVK